MAFSYALYIAMFISVMEELGKVELPIVLRSSSSFEESIVGMDTPLLFPEAAAKASIVRTQELMVVLVSSSTVASETASSSVSVAAISLPCFIIALTTTSRYASLTVRRTESTAVSVILVATAFFFAFS